MTVHRASAFFFLWVLFTSCPLWAAPKTTIFYYDDSSAPVVHLDRISPLTDGLKAIFAMYALQNGAGCTGEHETLSCSLTEALGLGQQCSDKHVSLVHAWFKDGIPKMSGYGNHVYRKVSQGTLSSICYKMPDSATYQRRWDIIRIEKSGNRVMVDAHGGWLVREGSGSFKYQSEYEIGQGTVKIISHQEFLSKEKQ